MDDKILLTVLIPTYNRKAELEKTLQALSKQTNTNFRVLISDNGSNYSIEDDILSHFTEEFAGRVNIFHRPTNLGGIANILGLFSLCNTVWGWMLGDDDLVKKDAIDNIFETIDRNPNINAIWFSIDKKIKGTNMLNSVLDLHKILSTHENRGDFIFCSNKVYRIDSVSDYFDITYRYSYTGVAHCFPIIEMLKENKAVCVVGERVIADHSGFVDGEITWDVSKTVSGLATLMNYPTGLTWKHHCEFVRTVMFKPMFVFRYYIRADKKPWNHRYYLRNIYDSCYKYTYSGVRKFVIKLLYYISSTNVGWNVLKILERIKSQR